MVSLHAVRPVCQAARCRVARATHVHVCRRGYVTIETILLKNITDMADLTEEELQALYAWIDEIPLSRQKKSITRDFSDGGEPVLKTL